MPDQNQPPAQSVTFSRERSLPTQLVSLGLSWDVSFNDAKFMFLSNGWTVTKEDTNFDRTAPSMSREVGRLGLEVATMGLWQSSGGASHTQFTGELHAQSGNTSMELRFNKLIPIKEADLGTQGTLASVTATFGANMG